MTKEFDIMFQRLCEAGPEKYEMHELSGSTRRKYWVHDNFYMSTDDKSCLWFLHKLAESLGGVVWVRPHYKDSTWKIFGWYGLFDSGDGPIDTVEYDLSAGHVKAQTLALESAVIGLMEWYLQNRRNK